MIQTYTLNPKNPDPKNPESTPKPDDPAIASALWCEANNVKKLSSQFTSAQTCEIRGIIAAGPMSQFK